MPGLAVHHQHLQNKFCFTLCVDLNVVFEIKIFPNEEILRVNSFHHQAINKLAKGFEVDAYSEGDKIIEAIHLKDDNQWIFAFQFHPEQHIRCDNHFLPIFKELIRQAKISR